MVATKKNIVIEQGARFSRGVVVYTDKTKAAVEDLTGYSGEMHIRETLESSTTIAELTTANGGIVITGASGLIEMYISKTATAAMDFENGVYDLEITPSGDAEATRRILEGKVSFKKEVTR